MHRFPKTRPFAPVNAARLAAEAAFAPPLIEEAKPASNALVIVKKKRHLDAPATAEATGNPEHDADRAPRIFRVAGLPHAERDVHDEPAPETPSARRARRHAVTRVTRPSPPITLATAPAASGVDLAALALELETSMAAREHAAVEAQLDRLQAQLGELDRVLAGIAKAREFTLNDNSLSGQWQELAQTADRLLEGLPVPA